MLTDILTEKFNGIKGLAKGEKGERVFPTLYILYSFSFFLEKLMLTTLTSSPFAL
jgi:hypothetical protein